MQEVKQVQSSVQERLEVLEGRQQSEEAYLSSLQELQEAILSQSATIQDDIKDRMAQLRQVLDDREQYLLSKVRPLPPLGCLCRACQSPSVLLWRVLHRCGRQSRTS